MPRTELQWQWHGSAFDEAYKETITQYYGFLGPCRSCSDLTEGAPMGGAEEETQVERAITIDWDLKLSTAGTQYKYGKAILADAFRRMEMVADLEISYVRAVTPHKR